MESGRFDQWSRTFGARRSRRGLTGFATGALIALGLATGVDAKKHHKKKKKRKKGGGACDAPYFACDGECRLQGACCDSDPSRNCATLHEGEGGNWVCCSYAGFGCFDLANDSLNCGACGRACRTGQQCLNGDCLS